LDPQDAYELISILTDNNARAFVFGANSPLTLPGRVVAAKTGTTQNFRDGWTLGFTPSLAAGVWAGNNDGTLLKQGSDGVVVAAPIWHDFMEQALATSTPETFAVPPGITQVTVDAVSGLLPTDATPTTKVETFASYSVPTSYDNVHIKVPYDSTTGQPATSLTPPADITYQYYKVLHSEMPNNPNWENPVIAWALANGYSYPPTEATTTPVTTTGQGPTVNILDPADGQTITQMPFTVTVSASSNNPIARVDLSIDGQFYQSLTQAPYVFSVNQNMTDGPYTIAAHAVDITGATSDTSVNINLSLSAPLTLTQPQDQSALQFPTILTAASNVLFNNVSFYYENSQGQTKLIGPAQNTDHTDQYHYTINWQTPPPSGTYQLYAQSDNGYTSKKIQVTIP
jgi:membrane carboxypeptidase/penicillin-binding protein PbpC